MSLQNQLDEIILGIPAGVEDYQARRNEDIAAVREGLKLAEAFKAFSRAFRITSSKSPVSNDYFIEIRSSDGKASLLAKTDKDGSFAIESAVKAMEARKGGR